MHNFSDTQLIILIQASNDEQAISELVNRYYGKLHQIVSHKISLTSDVADIVQEIIIKIVTRIEQLQDPSKFKIWIQQIVNSHVNDYYRSTSCRKECSLDQANLEGLEAFIISDSSEDVMLGKLEASDIYDIILGFPSDKTRPFLLRHLHNMSYDEIAAMTDENTSTIRGRIARTKTFLIDEAFDTSRPKEIRTDLALKISHIVSDNIYLEHHLKNDYFQNNLLLGMIDPRRTANTKPKIYFYKSLDNIAILSRINPDLLVCMIKVKSKNALPILLNRIPTANKLHLALLNTEYITYAKKYLKFITETINYSFVASPSSIVEPLRSQQVTESSLDDTRVLGYLLERDPKLKDLVNVLTSEYGNDFKNYKFYTTCNPETQKISAYAFFMHVDTHLWELGRYVSFDKSNNILVKDCIAAGTYKLLRQKYYVFNSGVTQHNTTFLELAPSLGFNESYRFFSGAVKIR